MNAERLILKPAYGRDYKKSKSILKDFEDNKDFLIVNVYGVYGRYNNKPINKEQIPLGTTIVFIYSDKKKMYTYNYVGKKNEVSI